MNSTAQILHGKADETSRTAPLADEPAILSFPGLEKQPALAPEPPSKRPKAKGKRKAKPKNKPYADFPLFAHDRGHWCKKVRGKFYYFGKVVDDPQGTAALETWLTQKDDLLAGRKPRPKAEPEGPTVEYVCFAFLDAKERQRDAGELSAKKFDEYKATAVRVADAFGRKRVVDDLRPDDFEKFRSTAAERWGVWRLSGEVQHVRTLFKYAYESGIIDRPMRFGPQFKKPSATIMRKHKKAGGERDIPAGVIRRILGAAGEPLRTMILLAVNCGMGNSDVGAVEFSHVDFTKGILDFPRPKTGIDRRAALWPETLAALRTWIERRPQPKAAEDADLVFITLHGNPWDEEKNKPLAKAFRKLVKRLKVDYTFYDFRRTFRTIGDETKDFPAVNLAMGHSDSTQGATYRQRIDEKRLREVATYVREWLFPTITTNG